VVTEHLSTNGVLIHSGIFPKQSAEILNLKPA